MFKTFKTIHDFTYYTINESLKYITVFNTMHHNIKMFSAMHHTCRQY